MLDSSPFKDPSLPRVGPNSNYGDYATNNMQYERPKSGNIVNDWPRVSAAQS